MSTNNKKEAAPDAVSFFAKKIIKGVDFLKKCAIIHIDENLMLSASLL